MFLDFGTLELAALELATPLALASLVGLMVSRMRFCSVDGDESFWCWVRVGIVEGGTGSSRRRRR